MTDNRKSLAKGHKLFLNGVEYLIKEELGRGGSCIVYSAEQVCTAGIVQNVRIKECYPAYTEISRNDDGTLSVPTADQNCFEEYIRSSGIAFAQNQHLRNTQGLVNSTIDTAELYRENGTVYTVMRCVEGCDYSKAEDDSIMSVLIRALAVGKVLKKYHENGWLNLDVKPENIFIIPETKEHIVLFDFDSLVSLNELKNGGDIRFSISDGYTAPEVLNGQWEKISIRTDIFSVGALVYFKIFGEVPHSLSLHDRVDFSRIKFPDTRYQPVLFRELTKFFRSTLATSPSGRFSSDEELIQSLERLIQLSDLSRAQLVCNFGYDAANFVGRLNELQRIDETLGRSHIVFLSGIGGIGKTELAKKYASEKSDELNRILFCYYNGSVEDTVCDSIQITDCEQESGEERSEYFRRKLRQLKNMVTDQDMIILDNFDVSSDEGLEELLECPCKFIITTREDYSCFNYEQIYVDCFDDIEDAISLFTIYDKHGYDSGEQACIRDIIELLERHTMAVELAAKYLADSDVLPSEFVEELRTNSGITSADSDIEVSQRKDGKRSIQTVTAHLMTLFNMSGFSDAEKELIGSLALLGNAVMSRKLFLDRFCKFSGNKGASNKMIKKGWIKYDSITGKISLHQVIMDLVYNELRPDADSCPHIMAAMVEYAEQDIDNAVDSHKRDMLVSVFLNRITGKGVGYANFLVKVCRFSDDPYEVLKTAEECCDDTPEGKKTLMKICQIHQEFAGFSLFCSRDDPEIPVDTVDTLLEYTQKYISLFEEKENTSERLIEKYIGIVSAIQGTWLNGKLYREDGCAEDCTSRITDFAISLIDKADQLIVSDDDIAPHEKRRYFQQISSFFTEYPMSMNMFSSDFYGEKYNSVNRLKRYIELSSHYNVPKEDDLRDSYNYPYMRGVKELKEGHYDKAISVLEYAVRDENSAIKTVEAYLRKGDKEHALSCAENAINTNMYEPSGELKLALARCYTECGMIDNAKELCLQIIGIDMAKASKYTLIKTNYLLYTLETDRKQRDDYWESCLSILNTIDFKDVEESFDDTLGSFLIDYWLSVGSPANAIACCYDFIKEYELGVCALSDFVFDRSEEYGVPEYSILLCMCYANYVFVSDDFMEYYLDRAVKLLNDSDTTSFDEYLLNLIYSEFPSWSLEDFGEYAAKCDYYLVGCRKAESMSLHDELSMWWDYARRDCGRNTRECWDSIFQIIDINLDNHEIQDFIFGSYKECLIGKVNYHYEIGDIDGAVSVYAHGMRNVIAFGCGNGFIPDENCEDTENDRYEKISDFIFYLVQVEDSQEELLPRKFIAKLIAAVIMLSHSCEPDLIPVFENPDSEELDRLYNALDETLNLPDAGIYVNEVWFKYSTFVKNSPAEFKRFADLFTDYFARNSSDDFSFRR